MMNSKLGWIKFGAKLVISGLVGLFTGAIADNVSATASGGKWSKIGAKAGGGLVGLYIGDKVTDHIVDGVFDMLGMSEEEEEEDDAE